MTRRPDSQDRRPSCQCRPRPCVCGDPHPELSPPSPGWRWRSLPSLVPLLFGYLQVADRKLDLIRKEFKTMAEQTQAAAAELVKDLHRLADGYNAKDAVITALTTENRELRAALESADADKAAAVASARSDEDAAGAAAITEADAIVEGLSPEPVADPPAGGGDAPAEPAPDAPADGS